MILTALPSPGVNLESQKLRTSAWKAICSVELAAPCSRAVELSEFFLAAAQAARKASTGATTLRCTVLDSVGATVGQGVLSIEGDQNVVYLDSYIKP